MNNKARITYDDCPINPRVEYDHVFTIEQTRRNNRYSIGDDKHCSSHYDTALEFMIDKLCYQSDNAERVDRLSRLYDENDELTRFQEMELVRIFRRNYYAYGVYMNDRSGELSIDLNLVPDDYPDAVIYCSVAEFAKHVIPLDRAASVARYEIEEYSAYCSGQCFVVEILEQCGCCDEWSYADGCSGFSSVDYARQYIRSEYQKITTIEECL